MLADAASLLDLSFRLRRKTLEQFFRSQVRQSSPLYLSASTADLSEIDKWIGHVGQQLDGIIAKRAEGPYRPGDDHCMVKIKNYRSADCVVGGFRDRAIGSARNELLLGLYDQKGHLQYVSSVGIDAKQKQQVGKLRPKKTTTFYDRQPGEKSHWSGEAAGPCKPVAPTKVVEVRYDHFSDQRFRHGCTFLRVREDKLPKDCLLEQVLLATRIWSGSGDFASTQKWLAFTTSFVSAGGSATWRDSLKSLAQRQRLKLRSTLSRISEKC
jgi:ATP-dependent DNA ligase